MGQPKGSKNKNKTSRKVKEKVNAATKCRIAQVMSDTLICHHGVFVAEKITQLILEKTVAARKIREEKDGTT